MPNNHPPTPGGQNPKFASPETAPQKQLEDLRSKFRLAPLPTGVNKIAGLVQGKNSASMDEITNILDPDQMTSQRLISMAYPRPAARVGATVQMATSRLGLNRVIVVLVGDLLTQALMETFETMVALPVEIGNSSAMTSAEHGYLTGSVKFTGQATGQVTLTFSPHLSLLITTKLLGGNLEDHDAEAIHDAIGELVNIITGSLQSKLCDAGLPSEVGLPEVSYQASLPKEPVPGGSMDQFFFCQGAHTLAVTLSIDPSGARAPNTKGTSWRANEA